jgi:hypothetical protein
MRAGRITGGVRRAPALALVLIASTLGVVLPAKPASAGVCSPYLRALTPITQNLGGIPRVWGRVKLLSNGNPCLGHHTIDVTIQANAGGGWVTYGNIRYERLPAQELGAVFTSYYINRNCGVQYRSTWRLDGGTSSTGTAVRYC